mmetsp:Transcript_18801/g.34019  ORF Transcript_18801/g.34019 Transcript_18801/m.34019 type:complete len:90 (-) Transcript_18801:260-529(-)
MHLPSKMHTESWESFHKRHGTQRTPTTGTFCGCMDGATECSLYSALKGLFHPAPVRTRGGPQPPPTMKNSASDSSSLSLHKKKRSQRLP